MSEIRLAWGPGESRLALVEDGQAVEFAIDRADLVAGALFLGRVVEIAPKLNAAFVDIGLDRPGFLPGGHTLSQGQAVLVRARADAVAGKGAVLSADVSLPGRFLAYSPQRVGLNVSRRLEAPVRERLLAELGGLVGAGEGVVVRTAAATAAAADLVAELEALRDQWRAIETARAAARPPALLWRADPLVRLLADNPGIDRVVVEDAATFATLRRRFGALVERGPAFDDDMEDAFAEALAPSVALAGGGRVTIERTAALTAIDVDSGPAKGFESNAQAVAAIARHLRLRGIGGQIVVDFVSGGGKGALARLAAELKQAVAADPVPTHVFGATPLGLIELTRERRGPSLAELMQEHDTRARPQAAAYAALRRAVAEAGHRPGRALAVVVAPDVAAALAAMPAALSEAADRIGRPLAVRPDPARAREDVSVEEVT